MMRILIFFLLVSSSTFGQRPQLYFGSTPPGGDISRESTLITVRDSSFNLMNDYQIVRYELIIPGLAQILRSPGNQITEAHSNFIKSLKNNTNITIIVTIISPDGMNRLVSASYKVP